jgi:hypothetical protein
MIVLRKIDIVLLFKVRLQNGLCFPYLDKALKGLAVSPLSFCKGRYNDMEGL